MRRSAPKPILHGSERVVLCFDLWVWVGITSCVFPCLHAAVTLAVTAPLVKTGVWYFSITSQQINSPQLPAKGRPKDMPRNTVAYSGLTACGSPQPHCRRPQRVPLLQRQGWCGLRWPGGGLWDSKFCTHPPGSRHFQPSINQSVIFGKPVNHTPPGGVSQSGMQETLTTNVKLAGAFNARSLLWFIADAPPC